MNFRKSLAAILVGNAIYLLLMPHLPPFARHEIYAIDFGLLLDFCICVAVWGVITLLTRHKTSRR